MSAAKEIIPVLALLFSGLVQGQEADDYTDEYKRLGSVKSISSFGPDLFGEQVNVATGSLSFIHTDLSLPGNFRLPMAVARSRKTGELLGTDGMFGDWDLDIPRLHGVFPSTHFYANKGWAVYGPNVTLSYKRCSEYGEPYYGKTSRGDSVFAETYWNGNFLYLPGQGDQEIVQRATGNTQSPGVVADYPLVTSGGYQFTCGVQLTEGGIGEGFTVIGPDGTTYLFTHMATRFATNMAVRAGANIDNKLFDLGSPSGSGAGGKSSQKSILYRDEVVIFPTKIVDRLGNWISYSWTNGLLNSMTASDGRTIKFSYSAGKVSTVSDGDRVWTYGYTGSDLSSVTLPDSSRWTFALGALKSGISYSGSPSCDSAGVFSRTPRSGTITHPSGAIGTFELTPTLHGRSLVVRTCMPNGSPSDGDHALFPRWYVVLSLTTKSISGPALTGLTWTHAYSVAEASWSNCTTNCGLTKLVTVTDPQGNRSRQTFGTVWMQNDGKLLNVEDVSPGGSVLRSTSYAYANWAADGGLPFPQYVGWSLAQGDHFSAEQLTPQRSKVISQQGATFSWAVNTFDVFAHPVNVTRSSSLGYTATEKITLVNILPRWIIGRESEVLEITTNVVKRAATIDNANGNVLQRSEFGAVKASYTYNTDGTLATVTDGAGAAHTVTLKDWYRGVPRSITYPKDIGGFAGTKTSIVNGYGRITSLTNEAASTTVYDYDSLGRLKSITYPGGDPVAYNATALTFAPMTSGAYGLPAGAWKQTITTGNGVEENYFDALWRPVIHRQFDAGNVDATQRFVVKDYEPDGQVAFESYPVAKLADYNAALTGTWTEHDALNRPVKQSQSSELGTLVTNWAYLTGFKTQQTNPRGKVTNTWFQAFDEPVETAPMQIDHPAGISTAFGRNIFGLTTVMSQSGVYGSGRLTATRRYVYDANFRLCKRIEPEKGATVMDYDAAGNVIWEANGLALLDSSKCDRASVAAAAKVTHSYDNLNRVYNTAYGDGATPAIARSWTLDGLPAGITRGGSTWTYDYYKLRKLKSETLSFTGGGAYPVNWRLNANGFVDQLTYPDNVAVGVGLNALGETASVGIHATNVARYPNGVVASFKYGNGATHSVGMNGRFLPSTSIDKTSSGTLILSDSYGYDANGNVLSITDAAQAGLTTRSMGYDDADRLTSTASSRQWGTATFDYDPLDNLRQSVVGQRTVSVGIDAATNRINALTIGGQPQAVAYSAAGELKQRGNWLYNWDQDGRLASLSGSTAESYDYDGLGHRVVRHLTDGSLMVTIYSGQGQLLFTQKINAAGAVTTNTKHLYLDGKLVTEIVNNSSVSYVHTDALGSPVARSDTNQVISARTQYDPYGELWAGTDPVGVGYAGHVSDIATGLSYMQQRYYDPLLGRFLSTDSVEADINSGVNFNRYWYANNSPFKYWDPDGNEPAAQQLPSFFSLTTVEGAKRGVTLDQAVQRGAVTEAVTMPAVALATAGIPLAVGAGAASFGSSAGYSASVGAFGAAKTWRGIFEIVKQLNRLLGDDQPVEPMIPPAMKESGLKELLKDVAKQRDLKNSKIAKPAEQSPPKPVVDKTPPVEHSGQ